MNFEDLLNKYVRIYCINMEDTIGILNSWNSDGILIKTDTSFCFYPWQEVTCVEYTLPETASVKSVVAKKQELKITCSDSHIRKEKYKQVENILPEDYGTDWTDEGDGDEEFMITNDDGADSIRVNLEEEEIVVYYDKDLELAKKIAAAIEILNIEKDYQE